MFRTVRGATLGASFAAVMTSASTGFSRLSSYTMYACAYAVASCIARSGSEFLTENVRMSLPSVVETEEFSRNVLPIESGVRNVLEHLIHDGRRPGKRCLRLRNALRIDERAPIATRVDQHLRGRLVRGCLDERDPDDRRRKEDDDHEEDELPSSEDPQVIQEARDDRPVRRSDVSVHGRYWAASSRASRPGTP